ncbi:MAG: hypothetical protein MR936_05635 [Eubacterium sp.]|nr:hypothetical protein [Eubacterium sp.]MCI6996275.1 hypothetical protein [Eubacterium sp.]
MKVWDRQYIGILADLSDNDDDRNKRNNVFINAPNSIQYSIKSLTLPQQDITIVTGYMSSFDRETDIDDDQYADNNSRIEYFKKAVEDKVFIYTYKKTGDGNGGKLQNSRASLVPRPRGFCLDDRFYPLPVFGKKTDEVEAWEYDHSFRLFRTCKSLGEFRTLIQERRSLGATYGYDPDAFTPSFIIWYEDNKFYAVGHVIKNYQASSGGLVVECDNLVSLEINTYFNKVVFQESVNPSLMFVPESVYKIIESKIIDDEEDATEIAMTPNFVEVISNDMGSDSADVKIENVCETIREEQNVTEKVVEEAKIGTSIQLHEPSKTDEGIIQMMDYHSTKSGLHYDIKDFINFHTSVKCGNLVILSGLSGTGKSCIVDMYANAIGIKTTTDPDADKRFLFIPVRPSWNDDSDLLGYVDLVHMVYRPSDSGFVDFLVKAQKTENKDKIYLVCFDEMNLARVEHYFSQFLSLLERPEGKRNLQLYDEQYSGKLYNSKDYPSSINIGENVKFIGTVNIDESTYHFSDKVLDRANVIELNVLNYATDWDVAAKKYNKTISTPIWSMEDYKKICVDPISNCKVHELLWDIHIMLHRASSKFGVGPRVVKSIDLYLANLPVAFQSEFSISDGIDIQVAQRVLTKVRGSENELGDILDSKQEDSFESIFDKYHELSSFEKCREVLSQKQKELKAYGYCI